MIVAGCDPGAQGAIALLDAEPRRIINLIDMPMAGSELMVRDLVLTLEWALDGRRVGSIYIEQQAPFVKNSEAKIGAKTAFSIGQRYMAIKAIAACLGWPTEIIRPAEWQKHYGIKKADKEISRHTANELMPEDARWWTVRRGYCTKAQASGRSEAALLALYAARRLSGLGNPAPVEGLLAGAA